jgi:hypothetical protein
MVSSPRDHDIPLPVKAHYGQAMVTGRDMPVTGGHPATMRFPPVGGLPGGPSVDRITARPPRNAPHAAPTHPRGNPASGG